MALPKKRISRARGRKGRTHYKANVNATSSCPQCGQSKLPHHACPNCGYYKGRPVISAKN